MLWVGGGFYAFTVLSVALGYHRLFTHMGYECGPVVRAVLLIGGGLSLEGDVDGWVRTHRLHHKFADRPGDPHSPFQYNGSFWRNLKGIGWSHVGWLFYKCETPEPQGSDRLLSDPLIQLQKRNYHWLIVATFALPTLICAASGLATGGWKGMLVQGLDGALVAGVLRVVLLQHVTWCINSLSHLRGQRLSIVEIKANGKRVHHPSDGSRNVYGLKLLSGGEANHAMHHLFQRVAFHGWFPWSVDPAKWMLILLEKLRLVRDIVRPPKFEVVSLEVQLPEESFIRQAEQAKVLTTTS